MTVLKAFARQGLAAVAALALGACATAPGNDNDKAEGGGDGTCDRACLIAKGQPVATHRAKPVYPLAALSGKIGGCVVTSFVIGPDGKADEYEVLDSQPKGVFEGTTLSALNDWRFEPARPGRYAQTITYKIEADQKNSPVCIETPSYEQLNGKKTK
jgi:TonB family protein